MWATFDGHNDLLLNLWLNYPDQPERFFTGINGHLDFPRIKQAGLMGAVFAIFVPPHHYIAESHPSRAQLLTDPLEVMWQQLALLKKLAELSAGQAMLCTGAEQIRYCHANNIFAMVAHIEGADALDGEGHALEQFYQAGVRSLGPFWKNVNRFGAGVLANFPHSPDTGPGLTEQGRQLLSQLQHRAMLIDVSHMNEKSFWDTAHLTSQPLVATHSSVHALCQQSRNLTDKQLLAIRDSGGLIGINFGNPFIRQDGQRITDTAMQDLINHFLYVLDLIGDDHLAFGSDFDGVAVPDEVRDVRGLQLILNQLQQQGVPEQSLQKIAHQNWLRVLERTWGQ